MVTLKEARARKALTLEQAAKLLGISVSTLRRYEAGRSFPDVPVIILFQLKLSLL